MEMKEFLQEVAKQIEERLDGVKAIPTESMKYNGVIQNGVAIRMNDQRISPILYLDLMYQRYKKGDLSIPEIVKRAIKEYETLPVLDISSFEASLSASNLLDKINIRLVNKEANKEMISKGMLLNYDVADTDLVALFYLEVVSDDKVIGGAGITEYMFETYFPKLSVEQLYHEVVYRVREEDVMFESMKNVMLKYLGCTEEDFDGIDIDENLIYLLSNKQRVYGAFMILSEIVRNMILEQFGATVYVIPSSVHELLIVSTSLGGDTKDLKEMVSQVNMTALEDEYVLSNNIYTYDATTGQLKIANDEVEE